MAEDSQLQHIIRDLRGAGGPAGGPIERAATYIENVIMQQRQPPPDHNVRDMMTRESLHILRDEREREIAESGLEDDYKYIQYLRDIHNGRYEHIARLIALTARTAGELPHDLIHPSTRNRIKQRIEREGMADDALLLQAIANEVDQICVPVGQSAWEELVDPGLVSNARIACYDIGQRLPRLRGMDMQHVLNTAAGYRQSNEKIRMFIDYFCAVVAARWRANSVLGSEPYKTGNQHTAVQQLLMDASHRLCEYTLREDRVVYARRPHPTRLSELRDLHTGAFAQDNIRPLHYGATW